MKIIWEKGKKILIITLVVIGIIALYFLFNNQKEIQICELNNEGYSFKYDSTWKVQEENETQVKLVHNSSSSELNMMIIQLEEENQYEEIDEIFDSFLYNIQEQNKDYKLLYKENAKITKNNFDGYKALFENDNAQVAISIYKQGSKLVVFVYEAEYDYFDILLDSVNSIIYEFELKEQRFDVISNINLVTEHIEYRKQDDLVAMLGKPSEQEIADSNYIVKYFIPSNFRSLEYNTMHGSYTFENLSIGKTIDLSTSILNCNIYEYLDKDNASNIYQKYSIEGTLDKLSEGPLTYIYKCNYSDITENIEIIFELNRSHIFIVKINSNGISIPEELVKMIKISDIKNVVGNTNSKIENGYLIGELKSYDDAYEKTETITLKLPENYHEEDQGKNLYQSRMYGLDFNEEKQIYEYEVTYEKIYSSIEDEIQSLDRYIDKSNGEYENFKKQEDIKINGKKFQVYQRGYTSNDTYYCNEKVLFYELQNDVYLVIIVKANDNKITNELIKNLTNFDVNVE